VFCGTESLVSAEKQIIGGGRRKMECPVCQSAERDRLIYIYVKDYLHLFENQDKIVILHIAPEDCLYSVFYKKINHREYVCGDKFEEGYTYNKHVKFMDITHIDWEDNYFDLILCNHVLEHIPDDRKAMQELYRVLKPNGKAILQVPLSRIIEETYEDFSITDPVERIRLFGQWDHCRIYARQDYELRLKQAGFTFCPEKIAANSYHRCGLDEREELLVVTKHTDDTD
jgi:SAM-dependent methyltransferase